MRALWNPYTILGKNKILREFNEFNSFFTKTNVLKNKQTMYIKDTMNHSDIKATITKTFTPTGNFTEDKARAEAYSKAVGMDHANTKMAVVAATQGFPAAAKAMMEESGGDYAAMRARYG